MQRTCLIVAACASAACSSGGAGREHDLAVPLMDAGGGLAEDGGGSGNLDGASSGDGGSGMDLSGRADLGSPVDLASRVDLATPPDLAWSGTFTVNVLANNVCKISSTPTTLAVSAGTSFKVHWVNSAASFYDIDIDKIDMFNQVPLIIGLEPGMSWTDSRDWCGIFTGTFSFRIRIGCDTYYIPVDCNK